MSREEQRQAVKSAIATIKKGHAEAEKLIRTALHEGDLPDRDDALAAARLMNAVTFGGWLNAMDARSIAAEAQETTGSSEEAERLEEAHEELRKARKHLRHAHNRYSDAVSKIIG